MIPEINCGLNSVTQEKISKVFSLHPRIERVLLYGSRAMGKFRMNSDIDLALAGADLTTTDLLKIKSEIDDLLLPYQVDVLLLQQIDHEPLREHILRIGKVFYDRGSHQKSPSS